MTRGFKQVELVQDYWSQAEEKKIYCIKNTKENTMGAIKMDSKMSFIQIIVNI